MAEPLARCACKNTFQDGVVNNNTGSIEPSKIKIGNMVIENIPFVTFRSHIGNQKNEDGIY